MSNRPMPRWPLLLIGAPAAVAIWSGWVGLGALCGFGPVHVLPGINDTLTINTAICLPVGMEAYAAYALAVWLRPVPVPDGAREFAKWSAAGALGLGMLGQIAFHVLTSLGWSRAPVAVTVAVSCVPVVVVGVAAVLIHLMSAPAPSGASAAASVKAKVPSLRELQAKHGCGQETARKIRAELAAFERTRGGPTPGYSPVPGALGAPAGVSPAGTAPAPAGVLNGGRRA